MTIASSIEASDDRASAGCLDRVGLEIELLTPPGMGRRDLGRAIARAESPTAATTPVFAFGLEHAPSSRAVLHHLSRAVAVSDAGNRPMCRIVDDFSIRDGLGEGLSPTGDYRIVSDDVRLLRLIERHTPPAAPLERALDPTARLFGSDVLTVDAGIRYQLDVGSANVASALLQAAGRERVCEIVTPVIADDHREAVDRLLAPARALGCEVPAEAAIHVHFDAAPFRDAGRFARLVNLFAGGAAELRARFGTNSACRNLGDVPDDVVELVNTPGFTQRRWPDAERSLHAVQLLKNCDLNLLNLRARFPDKDTVEVRILPGDLDTERIVGQVEELRSLLVDEVL